MGVGEVVEVGDTVVVEVVGVGGVGVGFGATIKFENAPYSSVINKFGQHVFFWQRGVA